MRPDSYDQLRRDVRTAVFRACRLRTHGHAVRADEQLADDVAAAQAELATAGLNDAAAAVRGWIEADEAIFAHAHLTSELLLERLPQPEPASTVLSAARPGLAAAPKLRDPAAGVPGLADLLDDMLSQERRPKPRPS